MNSEAGRLSSAQRDAVNRVVAQASDSNGVWSENVPDGSKAYAYMGGREKIHWSVNGPDGDNIACGVLGYRESL